MTEIVGLPVPFCPTCRMEQEAKLNQLKDDEKGDHSEKTSESSVWQVAVPHQHRQLVY